MTYEEAAEILNASTWTRRAADAWQSGHTVIHLTGQHVLTRAKRSTGKQSLEHLTEEEFRRQLEEETA